MLETVNNLDVQSLPEGGYVATSPDLPGLVAQRPPPARAGKEEVSKICASLYF